MSDWNRACLAHLTWLLFRGSDSLWIAWIRDVILNGKCFWTMSPNLSSSWCWRRLLKLRSTISFRPELILIMLEHKENAHSTKYLREI